MLRAIKINEKVFLYINHEQKYSKDFILKAVSANMKVIKYIDKIMIDDNVIIKSLSQKRN